MKKKKKKEGNNVSNSLMADKGFCLWQCSSLVERFKDLPSPVYRSDFHTFSEPPSRHLAL